MPFLQFQLRKFQKGRSEDRQLRMSALQRTEMFQRAVASPKSKVEPRQIPLGKGAAWLGRVPRPAIKFSARRVSRSEEHTSELQSQSNLVCRLLLVKQK